MDILVNETILRQSLDFMQLFSLPNEINVLINIIKIAYNSFFLPFHATEEEIMKTLEENMKQGNFLISQGKLEFIPLPVEHILVQKIIESKSEEVYGNFFIFMENLLIREIFTKNHLKLDLRQIIDIYCVISQEYYELVSQFELNEKPQLTTQGKILIRTQSWKELHNYWDLMYDYLAEDTVFATLIESYFQALEQDKFTGELSFEVVE